VAPLTLARLAPPALVEGAVRLSAAEVAERAARVAGGLRRLGVRAGDVVTFTAPPVLDSVLVFLACWRLGAVAAPLHHRLTDAERSGLVQRLDPRVQLDASTPPLGTAAAADDPGPAAPAVLLATSGSSGRPKIVRHTSGALARKGALMAAAHGLVPSDVVLMPAPLAHVSGLLNGILVPGAAGMTTVLMPRWSAPEGLRLIASERVSFMVGPPTYFVQMRADPGFCAAAVGSLRLLSCGGAGVGADFARQAAQDFDCVVKRTYGSTEAPTVTTSAVGDPPERGWSTDGRPVGDVELRLDGEELLVRGSELMASYDDGGGLDERGWFRTGDRARLEDGWLVCLGRLGDMLIRGGENVDPREVEEVCSRLPGVRQAVVVGYDDEEMGERVGLVVLAAHAPSAAELAAHCAAQGLARFKTPERALALDELPVLTIGKPDRQALRALLQSAGAGQAAAVSPERRSPRR